MNNEQMNAICYGSGSDLHSFFPLILLLFNSANHTTGDRERTRSRAFNLALNVFRIKVIVTFLSSSL